MTKETKVLETTRFISLSETAENWKNIILTDYSRFLRRDTQKAIINKNFNTKNETNKLIKFYQTLINKE